MPKPIPIEELWGRLTKLQGQEFETIRGLPFTYTITRTALRPSRAQWDIGWGDFEKALALVPIEGPGVISNLVRGSAYVWALLHDKRVRQQDW